MRASAFVLSSGIAAIYAVAHLPFLAPSLEDIDSINFALGLREFDVSRHQPHPPGYPVYTALGRLSLLAIDTAAPALDRVRGQALALAIWSALGGALALIAAQTFFRALDNHAGGASSPRAAPVSLLATVLLAVAPLFWISGLRPMSDLPGLAIALAAQALLLLSWTERRNLPYAAFVAAIAIGMRVQTIWLTFPLFAVLLVRHRSAGLTWLCSRPLAAFTAGGVVWVIPLLVASGGVDQYMRALGSQAGEDFAWVDMLWANPTPRRLAFALYETFVMPWGSISLAVAAGVAAGVGLVAAAARAPRALPLVGIAFGPYALFHLLVQETSHVRYALPLLVPIAWLISVGIWSAGRAAPLLAAGIVVFAAWISFTGTAAYASESHPAFRAIADMSAVAPAEQPAAVYAHYAVRRPLQAQPPHGVRAVEPPRTSEWTGLVDYWRNGGTAPVWFLADPRRTDLALIDPQSRRNVREYRWRAADRFELSGTRPAAVDWYRFSQPGWFAGEGWSLTPELGGMTRLQGTGIDRRPLHAFVRRRPDPMIAIVGARHLGNPAHGAVSFTFAVDGRQVDEWTLDPKVDLNALRVLQLPAGILEGSGSYARVAISARPSGATSPTPPVAIRQFDIQPASGLVYAFDEGWHEEEYENATGLRWRWSSGRSVIRVLPPQAVRLRLRGESPLKYVGEPPTARITAGDRIVAELRPDADFEWTVLIPDEAARASDGRIAVETSPVYLPGKAEGTSDERQLGLRLFDIAVIPSGRD